MKVSYGRRQQRDKGCLASCWLRTPQYAWGLGPWRKLRRPNSKRMVARRWHLVTSLPACAVRSARRACCRPRAASCETSRRGDGYRLRQFPCQWHTVYTMLACASFEACECGDADYAVHDWLTIILNCCKLLVPHYCLQLHPVFLVYSDWNRRSYSNLTNVAVSWL
jgi:hypothetical protein